MDIDNVHIKKMFKETLTEEEREIISAFSVICREGLSLDVVCNVLMQDRPQNFNSLINELNARNWIFCDCQTIYIEESVVETVLKIHPIKINMAIRMLISLTKYIVLQPLDDMIPRQQYFVLARLFLTYLMDYWDLYANNSQLTSLFSDAIISFATNVELSFYGNKRQLVHCLEDRIDFKLLAFLKELNIIHSEGVVYRLLGELYSHIFRYDEARVWIRKAEAILGDDAELFMVKAKMSENLGLSGKAFQWAWQAYKLNKESMNDDANIEVCLYISYLCAVNESKVNSKYWRKIARSLMGNRSVPCCHKFNIILKEIEALIYLDDASLARQILDSAELDVYKLYGGDAPEMARISYIRSLVDGEVGHLRKSNEYYRRYVNTIHLNYGVSVGDTAVLYSAIINDNIIRGNNNTADIFAIKMQDLYAEGSNIAPGVRLSHFANCASNLADEVFNLSSTYLETAQKIYEEELKPEEELLAEIAPVFHNGIIPNSVLMTEEFRIINIVTINICLGEGRYDDAKQLIEELANKEKDCLERLKWNIHLGRTLIKEGKLDDGLNVWKDVISEVPKAHKFEITKEIAEWARSYDLFYDAIDFYKQALQPTVSVYGKTYEIAEALQCYADVLVICGLKGDDDLWREALFFLNSIGDKDGIALLYLSWGITKQDHEAEVLLNKAIDNWEPEQYAYDETLSKMYYFLCCTQAMQGKTEDARFSAHKAVELFPTDFPLHLLEDIEGYL